MDALLSYLRAILQKNRNFFFAREIPYGLALIRIMLPWILMLNALPRWFHAREIYSLDGAPTPLAENYGVYGISPIFAAPIAVGLSTALVFALVALSAGWCTRISAIASLLIYTYFSWTDSISTATKYTVISSHILLLLSVADSGAIWSADFWLKNRRHRRLYGYDLSPEALRSAVWPQRLIQLLLAVVYLGAAVTKFRTPAFFSGDQLMYWMMTYIYQRHWLGDYLSQLPVLLVIGGYATVLWECAWVYCMWRPGFKMAALIMGVIFHVLTYPTLGLVSFPLVMMVAYFAYVETEDAVRWAIVARHIRERFSGFSWLRVPAPLRCGSLISFSPLDKSGLRPAWVATFLLVFLGTIGLGIAAEHVYDPYRVRGANGPLALRPLNDEEAVRLLTPDEKLRESDKFFALDVGTTLVGDHLFDRRKEFRQGQLVYAQISLNPPHEDMWVECQLYEAGAAGKPGDASGKLVPKKLIDQVGNVFTRDNTRGNFSFLLGERLVPGEYFFVVQSAGQVVLSKKFTLHAKSPTLAAQ